MQCDTAPSQTLRSITLRGRSQQLKFTTDPKVSNTAGSPTAKYHTAQSPTAQYHTAQGFARNNFVFAGLSLHSLRILIFCLNMYMCTIAT